MAEEQPDRFGERKAPFRTRIEALFAADGRSAVLLRRGPRLHHRLIKWDLGSDTFEHGQWMKGTVHLWDLNSHGDKLIYWARQWHRSAPRHEGGEDGPWDPADDASPRRLRKSGKRKTPRYMRKQTAETLRRAAQKPRRNEGLWTAVSTPPYFSALAIWPCHGHWTGGGWFKDDHTILLQEDERGLIPKLNTRLPDNLVVRCPFMHGNYFGQMEMTRSADQPTYIDGRRNRFDGLARALRASGVFYIEWFFEIGRDLLFAADGQVFRLRNHAQVDAERVLDEAKRLIDLRPMRFELTKPPLKALTWHDRRRSPARKVRGPRRREPPPFDI